MSIDPIARDMQERTFDAAVDDLVELGKHWKRNRDRKITSHNVRRAILGTCADLLSVDAEMSSPVATTDDTEVKP